MAQQEPVSFQGLVSCDTSLCISTMRLGAIGEKVEARRPKILSASTPSDGGSTLRVEVRRRMQVQAVGRRM